MFKLDSWLEIAKLAALKGGQHLLENQGKEPEVLLNQGRDIKLQLDVDTEQLIKGILTSQSAFSILGEETGLSNDLGEFYWVVDPLDGTSNFLRGIPISCVSIALMQNVTPILGVIYDFNHDNLYFGHIESQAFVNHEEIVVSDYANKSQATLVTGIPAKTKYLDIEFKQMIDDFQQWKKVRMIGSAAMASIYVAAGKADAYKENGIFLWDIAAGAAIVNAAGGVVSIKNIQADYRVDAFFTNQHLAC